MRWLVLAVVVVFALPSIALASEPDQTLACPDQYEPDDLPFATPNLIRGGEVQTRNFCDDSEDWVGLPACQGRAYVIETANLGDYADTILELFDPRATSLIASDDDGGGYYASRLTWIATGTGTFHVRVKQADASTGPRREYDLRVVGDTTPCNLWVRSFGVAAWDDAAAVAQERDGDFLLVGRTLVAGDSDWWLPAFYPEGRYQGGSPFGMFSDEAPHAIAIDNEGGQVVAGETTSWGPGRDSLVASWDYRGSLRWQMVMGRAGDEYSYSLVVTPSGAFVVSGASTSDSAGELDAWAYRQSYWGSVEWERAFGGSGNDELFASIPMADDGVLVVGYTESWGAGGKDGLVARFDALGNIQWIRAIGRSGNDELRAVVPTPGGGVLIAGTTAPSGLSAPADVWLTRLDGQGLTQWERVLTGPGDDRVLGAASAADGGVVVVGYSDSAVIGNYDAFAAKVSDSGTLEWSQRYGGLNADRFSAVTRVADGGFAFVGYTKSFGSTTADAWLIRANESGQVGATCAGSGPIPLLAELASSENTFVTIEARSLQPSLQSAGAWWKYGPSTDHWICEVWPPKEVSPPGAGVPLHFQSQTRIAWEGPSNNNAEVFNLYRGDVASLGAGNGPACLQPGLVNPFVEEPDSPTTATGWFYLVTAENVLGEGQLGSDSLGNARENTQSCP